MSLLDFFDVPTSDIVGNTDDWLNSVPDHMQELQIEPDDPNFTGLKSLGGEINPDDPDFTGAGPLSQQTDPEIAAQIARMNPTEVHKLAGIFGISLDGDTAKSLGKLVSAISLFRNAGPNGAQRQASMSGVNALVDRGAGSQYMGANTINAGTQPTYHGASNFIVQPPAGPLTQIRTQSDKKR